MSASAQTRYYHGSSPGAPGSDVTGTTVRHKRADNDIQDSNNPLPLPSSSTFAWAWRKSSKENFTTSPAGSISNLVWFGSSSPPTGILFCAWLASTYTQGSDADDGGITGFTDTSPNQATNNYTNFTSGSPLVVNSGTVLSNPSTGEGSQEFVVTQMGVNNTYAGGPGAISGLTITYRYSET